MTPTSRRLLGFRLCLSHCLAVGLLIGSLSGCGAGYYSERLEATRQQFAYFAMLDDKLAPSWREKGMALRVPRQFQIAWIPQAPADSEVDNEANGEEGSESETENRSGPPGLEYFGGEQPTGLVGVWTAKLPAGGDEVATAYLFALTNHDLWRDEDQAEIAKRFFEVVVEQDLRQIEGLPANHTSVEHWKQHAAQQGGYLPGKFYNRAAFENVRSTDGQTATLHVGLFKVEEAEVVLLLFLPDGTQLGTGMAEPLGLTLDTLQVDPKQSTSTGPASGGSDLGGF